MPPSPVVIERIQIDPRNRADAVWGIRVSFQHRWRAMPEGSSGAVNVRFATTDGRPVRASVDSPELRDRQGRLRVRAQTYAAGDSVAIADFFIPFYAMDLPAGPLELVMIFEAERSRSYHNMISHPLALQVPPPTFAIVKPPTRTITLLVSSVEVQPGSYDATLFRPHKGRPDLRWQVRFGNHPGAVIHSSRIHRDTFRTEWNRATPTFQWSEGDRLSIDVFDNDIAADDLLACFSFTYEQLHLAAARGRPLSRGAVRQMSLEVMVR